MVRDLQKRIMLYGAPTATVHKIALTPAQIEAWELPSAPVKNSDKRAAKFIEANGDKSAVELDALDPVDLQAIVKASIEEYIDPGRWSNVADKSTNDLREISEMMDTIKRCMAEARP